MVKSAELKTAITAAKAAEEVVMHYFGDDIERRLKSDQTPVTKADEEAEHVIAETIRSQFPEHGFLGEETGRSDTDSSCCWIVDPIDGTKNYVRGIPLFGTQIALMRNGRLELGVSNLPVMGELLYAERGQGAYLNEVQIHVTSQNSLADAQISFGGLDHFADVGQLGPVMEIVRCAGRIRAFGDAYAYHLLATGRCEAVAEAHIKAWDVAALTVIVEEAGGHCTDLAGRCIDVDVGSILATNGRLHEALLRLFATRS